MARKEVIHHPTLKRQAKVGEGFAKALINQGGWKSGPLPQTEPKTPPQKTTSKAD